MRRAVSILLVLLFATPLLAKDVPTRVYVYPETRKTNDFDELHGEKVADPYRWLEDDDSKEVVEWDKMQYAMMRERLDAYPRRAELEERFDAERALAGMPSLPTFRGGSRWFTQRPAGANHAVLYRTDEAATGDPEVVIDPNSWSEEQTASMKAWHVSPDGAYLAYRRDDKGSEETTLYILRLADRTLLPEVFTRTKHSSFEWLPDSTGFLYNRMPDPESVPAGESQYHDRLYYHRLGTLPLDDPIVYGQGRPMLEGAWIGTSTDEEHFFLGRGLPYKSVDMFAFSWKDGHAKLTPLITDGTRTWVDRVGDTYIFNTDKNTGSREIFTAPCKGDGSVGEWTKVAFPKGDNGVIKACWPVAAKYLLCHIVKNVASHLYVTPLQGGAMREIELPEPGTVGRDLSIKKGDTRVWFTFTSYTRPWTSFECDLAADNPVLKVVDTMPTTVKFENLRRVQTTYKSKDGTDIPIFLLHHKDTKLDGSAPTVLYGYGGFRVGLYPRFSRSRAMWAEQGGVFAVANLRGGDEFGEEWHQAGCLASKQNVYDDFIAAADWLVSTGKASRSNLAIQGGSNGGLLVAVCINQRPDLAGAVICGVPLTDMLRYHKFQFAKSWTKEYGNPDVAEEFAWIRPYSPYHNVKPKTAYPAILLTAGAVDGRVDAFHARKMAATWQVATTNEHRPVFLRVDYKGGHGAANLKLAYEEILDEWCFLLQELKQGD